MILFIHDFNKFIDKMFKNHIAKINLDLSLFVLEVKPMMLLLHSFSPQNLGLSFLSELLEKFVVELILIPLLLWMWREGEDWAGKAATVCLPPSKNFLFNHLEQTLSVNRVNINFGL